MLRDAADQQAAQARPFIPLLIDGDAAGHLWTYRDVTGRVIRERKNQMLLQWGRKQDVVDRWAAESWARRALQERQTPRRLQENASASFRTKLQPPQRISRRGTTPVVPFGSAVQSGPPP